MLLFPKGPRLQPADLRCWGKQGKAAGSLAHARSLSSANKALAHRKLVSKQVPSLERCWDRRAAGGWCLPWGR